MPGRCRLDTENIKLLIVPLALNYAFKSLCSAISFQTSQKYSYSHQTMSWQILATVLLPALVSEVIKANQSFLLQVEHLDFRMSCFIQRKGTRNRIAKKQKMKIDV